MLRHVDFVGTDVSEERSASIMRVIRIGELGTTLAVTSNRRTLLIMVNVVRFDVLTAMTMKRGVFWDVTPCDSCKNRRLGGTLRLLQQGDKNR
jgi:hypothetical protein